MPPPMFLGNNRAGGDESGLNVETLADTKTLISSDAQFQCLNPDGAIRTVTLPALANSVRLFFHIVNMGAVAAASWLDIQTAAGTRLGILPPGAWATVICDGTNWRIMRSPVELAFRSTTAVGNVGTGEDNLISIALPANLLHANGAALRICAWGKVSADGDNKTLKLHFGSATLLTSGALAANAKDWFLEARVVRTGAATQEAVAWGQFNGALIQADQTEPTQDETTALTVKCTGESSDNDDIVQEGMLVEYLPVLGTA